MNMDDSVVIGKWGEWVEVEEGVGDKWWWKKIN